MSITKKLLFLLLGLTIFTIIMFVLFGSNGIIKQEQDHYNETHLEEREEQNQKKNQVVVK